VQIMHLDMCHPRVNFKNQNEKKHFIAKCFLF
jgi:hypothetical protein